MRDYLTTFFINLIVSMICLSTIAVSKDLGVVGQAYIILEDDFFQLVEKKYQTMKTNGEWDKTQKAWQKQIVHYADRPHPVDDVTTTQSPRVYQFDPSITLSHDIFSYDRTMIAKAGTVINPLEMMPLHKALLFINADDLKQMEWALKKDKIFHGKTKWILVKGSIAETVKKLKKEVYFDQGGKLVSHFKIKHVPAILQQDGLLLKIDECVP